jgi:hypothetical protein
MVEGTVLDFRIHHCRNHTSVVCSLLCIDGYVLLDPTKVGSVVHQHMGLWVPVKTLRGC